MSSDVPHSSAATNNNTASHTTQQPKPDTMIASPLQSGNKRDFDDVTHRSGSHQATGKRSIALVREGRCGRSHSSAMGTPPITFPRDTGRPPIVVPCEGVSDRTETTQWGGRGVIKLYPPRLAVEGGVTSMFCGDNSLHSPVCCSDSRVPPPQGLLATSHIERAFDR